MPEAFLLDTNILSEPWVNRPDAQTMAWLDELDVEDAYISVMTLGELRKGIDRMSAGKRQAALETWLTQELPELFRDHVLPIDAGIADLWGAILAEYPNADALDSLLAATALMHDMTMVTRNERHFKIAGLKLLNPWNA